ncbi:MAG: methyltransferase domain-containing protein [Flavobacteriaceae bacterium]|jgi:hypothetical protein|nr:methyltransferase domain-containing protein [Flavobacteriaceae bacterium]
MKRNLEKYFEDYSNQPFEKIQVYYRKLKVLERINFHRPTNILEIGCGDSSQVLLDYDYKSLKIIEPSIKFYNKNKKIIKSNSNRNASIENVYFENFKNTDNVKYDFIIVSSLLHEIENLNIFLKKIFEMSNTETIIHINVPNANSFHRLLAKNMGIISSTSDKSESNLKLQTQRVFDLDLLREQVTSFNFKIIDSGSFFIKPFTHSQMQKLLDFKIIDLEVINGFYGLLGETELGSEIFVDIQK